MIATVSLTGASHAVTAGLEAIFLLALVGAIAALLVHRLRELRRPRVVLGSFADGDAVGLGMSFQRDLQVAIKEFQGSGIIRSDIATSDTGEMELRTAALAALLQGTLIGGIIALLDLLIPPTDLRLDGALLPSNGSGVGVWLRLSNRGRQVTQAVSLRHDEYASLMHAGGAAYESFTPLLTPAVVWLAYQIQIHLSPRPRKPSQDRPLYPFGVKDWLSYAYAMAGADRHVDEDPEMARRLYLRALECDSGNRVALLNLAVLDIRLGASRGSVRSLNRACNRLRQLRHNSDAGVGVPELMGKSGQIELIRRDGLWFRASYNVAFAYLIFAELRPEDSAELYDLAQKVLAELVNQIAWILAPGAPGPTSYSAEPSSIYRPAMSDFAQDLEPQVLVMAAAVLRRSGGDALTQALTASLVIHRSLMDAATPDRIVGYVRSREPDYRARYNVACYFSRAGDDDVRDGGDGASAYE